MSDKENCKKWREENKEKTLDYYQKNKTRILETKKRYRLLNREKILNHQKKFRMNNKEKVREQNRKYRRENTFPSLFCDLRQRIKRKKMLLETELDFDFLYLKELFLKQKGKCYWSGLTMMEERSNKHPFQISIERLDNNKGYCKDNIVLCCLMINLARNNCDYNTWTDIMKNQISIKYKRKKS